MGHLKQSRSQRNSQSSRQAILDAAVGQFPKSGYKDTSLRVIAELAGCDPGLVIKYFGSKEKLFREVVSKAAEDMVEYKGDPGEFSSVLADEIFDSYLEAGRGSDHLMLTLHSASSPEALKILREFGNERFYGHIAKKIKGPDGMARARMIGALVMGVAFLSKVDEDFHRSVERRRLRKMTRMLIETLLTARIE